jgi:uncharacterized membrane protein YeaQ/YmgE (transglycosylase-associated protein family)
MALGPVSTVRTVLRHQVPMPGGSPSTLPTDPTPARSRAGRGWLVYAAAMLILGLILFGMLVGAGAQLILGKSSKGIDWTLALVAGLVGSFVGGLLISLLSGDGLQFRVSGIIGSLVGALLVTAGWQWYRHRSKASHA